MLTRACLRHGAHVRMLQPRWREGLHGRPMQAPRLLQCCSTHQSMPLALHVTQNTRQERRADIKSMLQNSPACSKQHPTAFFTAKLDAYKDLLTQLWVCSQSMRSHIIPDT